VTQTDHNHRLAVGTCIVAKVGERGGSRSQSTGGGGVARGFLVARHRVQRGAFGQVIDTAKAELVVGGIDIAARPLV